EQILGRGRKVDGCVLSVLYSSIFRQEKGGRLERRPPNLEKESDRRLLVIPTAAIVAACRAIIILAIVTPARRAYVAPSAIAIGERPVAAIRTIRPATRKPPIVGVITRRPRRKGLSNRSSRHRRGFVDHIRGVCRRADIDWQNHPQAKRDHYPAHRTPPALSCPVRETTGWRTVFP